MSNHFTERLLSKFLSVRQRLESLLNLCRIYEIPSWTEDGDYGDFDHFCGPYRADVEELESSILSLNTLIEHLQHKLKSADDPTLPLCKNQWTIEKIEQFNDQREGSINLDVLAMLRLQTLAESIHQLNEDRYENERRDLNVERVASAITRAGNQKTFLLDLPSEILLHIFSYLPVQEWISAVAPSCRCFAQLILQHLYSHLDLSRLISVEDVCELFLNLSSLKSIAFIDWEEEVSLLSWAIWFDLLKRKQIPLQTLRFRNVSLCPILIGLMVEYFSDSLLNLTFDYQQGKTYEKFDLILCLLAKPTARLERLTASYQSGITNFGLKTLVTEIPKLIELNLIYVEAINDETVKRLCDKHHAWLEILKIDGAQLTDQALDWISQCLQLRSIMIEFCTNISGTNFFHFQKFLHLRELSLSKLNNVSAEYFHILFDSEHIFHHLKSLKLGECHLLDDPCLESIIKTCPNLIDFTCTWAYGVTTLGFNQIVKRCDQLTSLSLIGCYQISGEILFDVPEKYLRQIRSINFEQCNQIDDQILLDLYRRKRSLTLINYYGSTVEDEDEDEEET